MLLLKNLKKTLYGITLFEDLSLTVNLRERVGLVGVNGSGKSTLLKIILGMEEADSGSIDIQDERIGYLPQEIVCEPTDTVASFLGAYEHSDWQKPLRKVGLDADLLEVPVQALSGGQKTKLALAKVLMDQPTMLLLDEPTNHLDKTTLHWLEDFLLHFSGGVLIVSHDRELLSRVVTKILEIDPANNAVHEYIGNYEAYLEQREKRMERWAMRYEEQQQEKKRLEQWLVLKRQQASVHPNPATGRLIRNIEKRLEREILDKPIARPLDATVMRQGDLSGEVHASKRVLLLDRVSKTFGDRQVLCDVSFEVRGSERVLLVGENGSGKTTLLKLILGELEADSGEIRIGDNVYIGYFSQEHDVLDKENTVMDEFLRTDRMRQRPDNPRSALGAFLFKGETVYKKVGTLSQGERVRLTFAKLMHQENQLLILDEPTNHLDILSREVIEEALSQYQGACVIVSHDRFFLKSIGVTRILELKDGEVTEFYKAKPN